MAISKRSNKAKAFASLVILAATTLAGTLQNTARGSNDAPLPMPTNMACQGWQRDAVWVSWKDNATDETHYRVERSDNGGAFAEVATVSPNADGGYPTYIENGIANAGTVYRRYRVRAFRNSDASFSPYSQECSNRRVLETAVFRLFYGLLNGSDGCPTIDGQQVCLTNTNLPSGVNRFAQSQADALQGSADSFPRFGFTRPVAAVGGLDRIPVNVIWCDGGGCAGSASLGISPLLMEMPFDPVARTGDPIAPLVALHETFHFQQFRYGGINDPAGGWIYEGQARSIQDKVCIGADRNNCQSFDDIATGYAGYVPEVRGYLGNTNWPINRQEYAAALFWTYLSEKYGTSAPTDSVERGMNLLSRFYEVAEANPGDGIRVLDAALAALGSSARFRDIWKDFAVANYAKDLTGPSVPAKYRYADMAEPGGAYGPPRLTISTPLINGQQIISNSETVYQWGANYYEVRPAAGVPVIQVKVRQDSNHLLYHTVLAIKNNDIVAEYNLEARNLDYTLVNNAYDRVVLVVAGLEQLANYRVSFNGTQPQLRILRPSAGWVARVGSPATPDKMLVATEVIGGDGAALAGVDLRNFTFRVGAKDVPASSVYVSSTVQDQQWFIVRPPTQTVGGLYALSVSYGVLSDTKTGAVNYAARNDADSMLIIDKSGSMGASGKMEAAKQAGRVFVDSWRVGDKVGVVRFDTTAAVTMPLTSWTDTPGGGSRQTAFNSINGLVAGGCTHIGEALDLGFTELKTRGADDHDWALVLLSDGVEECPPFTKNFDQAVADIRNAPGKRPVIHTVSLGPDADALRMQRAAEQTGGTYQYVSLSAPSMSALSGPARDAASGDAGVRRSDTPASVNAANVNLSTASKFRAIATEILGRQQAFSRFGPLDPGTFTETVSIPLEPGASELLLTLSYDYPVVFILRTPAGVFVPQTASDPNFRHTIWRVPNPTGGTWTLEIFDPGPGLTAAGSPENVTPAAPNAPTAFLPNYYVHAALKSDVTMEIAFTAPVTDRVVGRPMPIVATLTDNAPIRGANVFAQITAPGDQIYVRRLYDDGQHGDGAADDGVYGATFYATGDMGSYNVLVSASGTGAISGPFTRERLGAFYMYGSGDTDGDGLPNEWEVLYGTDPNVADQLADPDGDGLINANERVRGSDPNNPDSDGGGESDSTDPSVRDPLDDRIRTPWAVAYPRDGRIYLRYLDLDDYQSMRIQRGPSAQGPFTQVAVDSPSDGLYLDTAVANGTQYCYRVVAVNTFGLASAPSPAECAVPRKDPLAPHGGVLINGGAAATPVNAVRLTLFASDTVSPHLDDPANPVPDPPADSATQVTEMLISNTPDFAGAVWEPYATSKTWTLSELSGLGDVFVRFRDSSGNVSDTAVATIWVGPGSPGLTRRLLPLIARQ